MAKRIRAEIHVRFLTALIVVAVSTSALPIITPSTVIPSHDAAVAGHRAGRWSIQSKTAARRMLQYVSTIQQVRDSASTKRDLFRLSMQWRRAHWARSGLGPTFNPAGRARSGQVRLFSRLLP